MDCCSCLESPLSSLCRVMIAVRGAVKRSESVCSSDMVVGFTSPRLPWRAGRAKSSRSRSETPFCPFRARRKCWRMESSSGCSNGATPSMVRRKYTQWPMRPWVNAAKAAWGSDLAMDASLSSSAVHVVTFS